MRRLGRHRYLLGLIALALTLALITAGTVFAATTRDPYYWSGLLVLPIGLSFLYRLFLLWRGPR